MRLVVFFCLITLNIFAQGDGLISGKETLSFPNGDRYEGMIKNSVFDGEGVYYYKSGEKLAGEFKNGAIWNGNGYLQLTEKAYYRGDFKLGKRDGKGFISFNDGSTYSGDFLENKITGKGTSNYTDGGKYIGDMVNGKKEGNGQYYNANGKIEFDGKWINNEPQAEVLSSYQTYSTVFKGCFNGLQTVSAYNQTIPCKVQMCLVVKPDLSIEGLNTLTIIIDGKYLVCEYFVSGYVNERYNTFSLSFSSFKSKDVLPNDLIWKKFNSLTGEIFKDPNKSGYTLQGKIDSEKFEVSN